MTNISELVTILSNTFGLQAGFLSFPQAAAESLITSIWQGIVVAIGLGICLRLAPRTIASHRFAIWTAGFLVIAGLPFLSILPHFAVAAAPLVSTGLVSAQAKPWLHLDLRWSLILTGLWLAASTFRAVDLALHSFELRRLRKTARQVKLPVDCASLPSIPGRSPIELCTTTCLGRPSVIGFLTPRILIPEWLFDQLTPAELDQIVLHEAEHLRRGDDWTNLIQKLSLVFFPLNPALLWIERQLCLEREMACDDGVIRRTHAPRAYAACLTGLAERGLQHRAGTLSHAPLSLGAWQHRSDLTRRVHSVLIRKQALGTVGARSLLAGLGVSLVLGAVELARCPQLIAFVPSQPDAQTAMIRDAAPLRYNDWQTAGVAQQPVSQLTSSRSTSRPHVTYLKAELGVRQAPSTYVPHTASHTVKFSRPVSAAPVPAPEMLKAKIPDSVPQSAQTPAWIVLTTWEQVEQPAEDSVQADNQATGRELNPELKPDTDQPVSHQSGRVFGKVTITRMIFRVLPASFVSSSPAAVSTRTGWFLFQL
jgi:beta-lactamase regulating signal transducer with metallopeptidase domain